MSELRQRLREARLYLVTPGRDEAFLDAALTGGVDMVQLREKRAADDAAIVAAARRFRRVCDAHGALLIINDRPDLVEPAQADGVHLGQDDMPVAQARELLGPEPLIGLSTHTPEQIDAASGEAVDYIGVGPIHATPTKPGRPAVGLELVRHAAQHSGIPFFAIGGIDTINAGRVRDCGATRIAVVRAITDARDPLAAARLLSLALTRGGEPVGTAQP